MKQVGSLLLAALLCSFILIDKDWVIVKSQKEGYQISFPKSPEEESQTVPSEVGELKMNMLTLETDSTMNDDNLVYLFNYTDYPEGKLNYSDTIMVESILKGAVNGGAKNVNGKLLSVEDIRYKNYMGKEAHIDFQDGLAVIVMRCYLVKNRIYLLEVIAYAGNNKNQNQQKFFNSFELL